MSSVSIVRAMLRHILSVFLLALSVASASAQVDLRTQDARNAPNNWNVSIGARVGAQPLFQGSRDFGLLLRPSFSMGRGLGSRWLSLEDDNISIGLINGDRWRAGATGQIVWQRRESQSRAALAGLGNTRLGAEIGGFVEIYPTDWLRARADVRQGFSAHSSVMADLKLDAFARIGERWTVAAGPRVKLAGNDYMDTFFGVNALQSARSGLPQFNPRGGVLSYGVAAQVSYDWTSRVQTTAFAQYERLSGDAGRAPLVTQRGRRDQLSVGLATRWTIDTGF